jgi:hypothetical protein
MEPPLAQRLRSMHMQDIKKMIGFLKKTVQFYEKTVWFSCFSGKTISFLEKSNGYCFILLNLKIEFSIKK